MSVLTEILDRFKYQYTEAMVQGGCINVFANFIEDQLSMEESDHESGSESENEFDYRFLNYSTNALCIIARESSSYREKVLKSTCLKVLLLEDNMNSEMAAGLFHFSTHLRQMVRIFCLLKRSLNGTSSLLCLGCQEEYQKDVRKI